MRDEAAITSRGARTVVPYPECEEIERLVRRLPPEVKEALDAHYVLRLRDDRAKARHCHTHLGEFYARLRCAKYCLVGMLMMTDV